MINARLFERRYGEGAFPRLQSMLDDSSISYRQIGGDFGLTKQAVSRIAQELGIDGSRRAADRARARPLLIRRNGDYPAHIRAVIAKLKRSGLEVSPYAAFVTSLRNAKLAWRTVVLVNGVPCRIYWRNGADFRQDGRGYIRFDITGKKTRANARVHRVGLFGFSHAGSVKIYVIPMRRLTKLRSLYLPPDGKYSTRTFNKPKRDWTVYEGAWHLIK